MGRPRDAGQAVSYRERIVVAVRIRAAEEVEHVRKQQCTSVCRLDLSRDANIGAMVPRQSCSPQGAGGPNVGVTTCVFAPPATLTVSIANCTGASGHPEWICQATLKRHSDAGARYEASTYAVCS